MTVCGHVSCRLAAELPKQTHTFTREYIQRINICIYLYAFLNVTVIISYYLPTLFITVITIMYIFISLHFLYICIRTYIYLYLCIPNRFCFNIRFVYMYTIYLYICIYMCFCTDFQLAQMPRNK